MTSTTAEVLNEINALFTWKPPSIMLLPDKKKLPAATRSPSFYDKHFSTGLVLKRVVRLPSLVQDLAENVDEALDAALATLPSLDGFITAEKRADDMTRLVEVVTDEKGVAEIYRQSTAIYCSQVASTLALHPSASFSRWRSLLSWTQSGPSRCGIAAGLLYFVGEGNNQTNNIARSAVMETMETNKRRIFEEMGKSRSPLATWEINSIGTGTAEGMKAVLNLGKFAWTFCNHRDCVSDPRHLKARMDVEQVVVRADAQVTPWSFTDDYPNTSPQRLVSQQVMRSTTSGPSKLFPQQSTSRSSDYESPTKVKSKKRKREDEDNYKTAQILVQQAWAQAVRADGTLIILHSGNHEIVCVRHRGSQTLYVSDVIEPPTCVDPGYGKLHVGIYIAAVKDTMDRKQQQLISSDEVEERKSDRFQGSAERRVPSDDELVAVEKMIQIATNRDIVLLYLQYDIYNSPIPASFLRSAPSILEPEHPLPLFSTQPIRTYRLEQCMTIVLTSEIGPGATGVIHRGTLKPEICDDVVPLDVVVKLAFDIELRDALRSEYEVYCHLRSKGVLQGIPTVLGFFDDSEDTACALVMLYAGVPLVEEPRRTFSVSDRKSALSTLESIHHAGILHGDICRENILMGDSGVTIIDFGYSKQSNSKKAKDYEIAKLRDLLDLYASECSVSTS